jgi:hypothetical protein
VLVILTSAHLRHGTTEVLHLRCHHRGRLRLPLTHRSCVMTHDTAWIIGHLAHCIGYALRHPLIAATGAVEFRSGTGITYADPVRSESYDAGRELAHIITGRRWDQC